VAVHVQSDVLRAFRVGQPGLPAEARLPPGPHKLHALARQLLHGAAPAVVRVDIPTAEHRGVRVNTVYFKEVRQAVCY